MEHVILKTARTEMKFPLGLIGPEDIVDAIGHEETIRYMDSVPSMTYTVEDAAQYLHFLDAIKDSNEHLQLGIFEGRTKKFIGMCTLESIDRINKCCDLGYWLSKPYVGQGYMRECASALIGYAKEVLGMKKCNAFVLTNHAKSIALLTRLGFECAETLPQSTENKGKLADRYRFGRTLA